MEYKQGLNLNLQGKIGTIKFMDEDGILFDSDNETEFIPFSLLEELQPVSTGQYVKLQKPSQEHWINIQVSDTGENMADCTQCGHQQVNMDEHICQTLLEYPENNINVPSFSEFKQLQEQITKYINFEDTQIDRLKKLWNMQHLKYHHNSFFVSVMKQLEDKKRLTEIQFDELKYLLDNGRSKYEAGILSNKN